MEQLTPWSRVLEKLSHSDRQEIPLFMKLEDSLPCSHEPATGPYPVPDASSPLPTPRSSKWSLPFSLMTKIFTYIYFTSLAIGLCPACIILHFLPL